MSHIVIEKEIAGRVMRMETGEIAKLATGSVLITYAESTVLCTCMRADPRPGLDFFPMQCDYREKLGAAGKFPGGFRKREGAPNEKEVLTMRNMDRPIRPLFPDGFIDEIQLQAFVMSHDGQNDTDVLACNGASASIMLTDAPFEGPVATVRVGRIVTNDGERFVLFPTQAQMEFSDLDLLLSGHADGVNMIEVGAAEVPEEQVLEAIRFGYEQGIKPLLEMQHELARAAGAPTEKRMGEPALPPKEIVEQVRSLVEAELTEARKIKGKHERGNAVKAIRDRMLAEHFAVPEDGTVGVVRAAEKRAAHAKEAFRTLEKKITRKLIVELGTRADGRALRELRPLSMKVGFLARTHGSALFQRGETQSVVTATLGTTRDEQIVDGLLAEYAKKFYLHYNFPPFCVGEAGRIMGPGRREIGHGALAERSLLAILPDIDEFPYTVRIVSDITESNGSSSMASVCGGCLAMMDAGVPIKATCAGISVGRFTDGEKRVHVLDIIGEEDFFGDMDFKVSGTRDGITGIQLDLKARGLWFDEISETFELAREGRLQLIEAMEKCIPAPRPDINRFAPRIITVFIDPEKIGKLIGPGGKMIRAIQERTGATIDVEDDGRVLIAAVDKEAGDRAKAEVEAIAAEVRVGAIYEGKVVSMKDFGAFIEIASGTDGMCHISELAEGYVKSVDEVVKIGDIIKVKVINVDDSGRIKLSRKAVLLDEKKAAEGAGQPVAAK